MGNRSLHVVDELDILTQLVRGRTLRTRRSRRIRAFVLLCVTAVALAALAISVRRPAPEQLQALEMEQSSTRQKLVALELRVALLEASSTASARMPMGAMASIAAPLPEPPGASPLPAGAGHQNHPRATTPELDPGLDR